MVKVREARPTDAEGRVDLRLWIDRIAEFTPLAEPARAQIVKACLAAEQAALRPADSQTQWGQSYSSFWVGLEMAEILAGLQLDADSLIAAVLYRAVRERQITCAEVAEQFGDTPAKLIRGVVRMAAISRLSNHSSDTVVGLHGHEQADNVRKMLVSLVDDVRVALIKLAERTCAIRAVKKAPLEKRQRVAREVSDIYAPLAHRLGIGHIKWELEDLAFRYLHPYDYKYIARLLDEKRVDRQEYIDTVINVLRSALTREGIETKAINGRAKHIYSIWRKMRKKSISFEEVYDIRAVRIMVGSEQDCYRCLGIVHSLWRNLPGEFDDYIANPKENGYRSLHTAVKGPQNKVLEIQIRTSNMHEEAEFGVCAHWRYKNSDTDRSKSYEQKIEWLRQVLDWHDEVGGNPWDDHLPRGIAQDRLYVFTPDGHVIDLPENATPLDFAFRIHSDVGLRCKGAKVNGRIVPINQPLHTGDQVEILTGNRESPSRDWLIPSLGYLTTSRARSRLQAWFRYQDRDQNIADGRALLDREFLRLAVDDVDYEQLANKLNLRTLDDLYAAVGVGDLSVDRVINAANRLFGQDTHDEPAVSLVGRAASQEPGGSDVYIDGVGSLMSTIAQCCKPVPGEGIAGYITLGRGVSIHRQDCPNLLQLSVDEPQRMIKVDWAEKPEQYYSVDIMVDAIDRHGLLRDITALLDREHINVSSMQTLSDKSRNSVAMSLRIEISSFADLSRVLGRLSRLPNVSAVRRKVS